MAEAHRGGPLPAMDAGLAENLATYVRVPTPVRPFRNSCWTLTGALGTVAGSDGVWHGEAGPCGRG